jgi:FtsZ-interacting cell division protein ZipA
MDDLRTALIVLGAVFIAGLALWERRRAARRARSTLLADPPAAVPAGALTASRRVEPGIGELSVPGPGAKLETLEVPVMLPTEPLRVDVSTESAVDVPAAVRHEPPKSEPGRREPERRAATAAPPAAAEPPVEAVETVEPGTRRPAIRWPPATTERVLSLRVVRTGGEAMPGRALREALEDAGLRHGPQRIYHLVDGDGNVLVSVANLVRPGSLVPGEMDTQVFRGLSLFTILPGAQSPPQMLEGLVRIARGIAARNGAVVQDEQGASLDAERLTQLRRSVQAYADAAGNGAP